MKFRVSVLCAAAMLLTACESSGTDTPPRRTAKKEAQELASRVAAAPTEVRTSVGEDPSQLLGLDRERLTAILGAPRFVRRDMATQLWRYRNKSCVLHVFFYRNDERDDEEMTVHHYEARNLDGVPSGARDCVNRLLDNRS